MLNSKEIEYICKYLDKQGVHYYDIQAELIDHFASAIEAMREKDPGVSFKKALHAAHRSFGGEKGFRKFFLISEHNVMRKTLLLMGRAILGFLKWPWIVITVLIGAIWHYILRDTVSEDVFNYFFFLGTGSLVLFAINYFRLRKTPWYLPRQANNAIGLIYYLIFYCGIPFQLRAHSENVWLMDGLFTLLTLCGIASLLLPAKLIRETERIYS